MNSAVTIDDFKLLTVLGQGSYAKVVLVRRNDASKQIYAMKILKKKHIQKKNQEEHIQAERNILVQCDHPFVIHLKYSFQTPEKLYFVLQYCPGGELYQLLEKRRRLTEDILKPENVMLDRDGYLRITDFGLAKERVLGNDAYSICGTPEYLAPQIIKKQGHGKPVDWWCFGSILYEMLVGIPPFYSQKQNRNQLFQRIKFDQLKFPSHVSNKLRNLINGLMKKNPAQRLGTQGAEQVRQHPWFQKVNWQDLLGKRVKPPFIPVVKGEEDTSNFSTEFTELDVLSFGDGQECKLYTDFSFDKDKMHDKQEETGSDEETEIQLLCDTDL